MPSQEKLAEFVAWSSKHITACRFSPKTDLPVQLLALNQHVAPRIDQGQPVSALGIPPNCPEPRTLVTEDCIRPGVQVL